MCEGESLRLVKYLAYHTSRYSPPHDGHVVVDDVDELATGAPARSTASCTTGSSAWSTISSDGSSGFWAASDVEIVGRPEGDVDRALADQQAMRWNLFQLAQASAQTGETASPPRASRRRGYEGHYFWDTEMYVAPFLSYTTPEAARNAVAVPLAACCPPRRDRARELSQRGALFPWRTINGEEASAYYAAGTAQYHINADDRLRPRAATSMPAATSSSSPPTGAEILVETARLWEDLGFYAHARRPAAFHIHGVTGPDEYTTVVNDNLYTNVMARFNLRRRRSRASSCWPRRPRTTLARRRAAGRARPTTRCAGGQACAEAMYLPYDEELGIHPQDNDFLDRRGRGTSAARRRSCSPCCCTSTRS